MTEAADAEWRADAVTTRTGRVVPVRATARRPSWEQLPLAVRSLIEELAGAIVTGAESAGTGFTPGFASRLDLADRRRVFVKAASSADDELHGWPLSEAYRDEVRKLSALPAGIAAPPVLWHRDAELDGLRWIVVGFQYVDAVPPRRPWRHDQLHLVLDKLVEIAPALAAVPPELELRPVAEGLIVDGLERLASVREQHGDSEWLRTVESLTMEGLERTRGDSIVHLDLRDDNVLIGAAGEVWFVDWNWPMLGAPWIDLVCLLLSARGDGIDVESMLLEHPLSRDVDPRSIDVLLAVLWSFWAAAVAKPVPQYSPHLRDHQAWYLEVTESWLRDRLGRR